MVMEDEASKYEKISDIFYCSTEVYRMYLLDCNASVVDAYYLCRNNVH